MQRSNLLANSERSKLSREEKSQRRTTDCSGFMH